MTRRMRIWKRVQLGSSSGSTLVIVISVVVAVTAAGAGAVLLTGGGDQPPTTGLDEAPADEPSPPVTEARVEGVLTGKAFYGAELTFSPDCSSGPCDVSATGKRAEVILAKPEGADFAALGAITKGTPVIYVSKKPRIPVDLGFTFDGRTYRGKLRFTQDCSVEGLKVPVSMHFKFEVVEAAFIDDEWRATELEATTKIRTGRKVFDQSDTDYPAFVEFEFTCLTQRDVQKNTASLES